MTISHNFSYERCYQIVDTIFELVYYGDDLGKNVSDSDVDQLLFSCSMEWENEKSDKLSEPMVWIGIYVALASFLCILAMGADLLHGFRTKKFWFPCKYFSLNAASITVITVAMKLPVDLSSMMPSYMDQLTKPGSLAFLCTMMANLTPSLASMDNNTLLPNVIGLSILVITVVVNICIQINTKLITNSPEGGPSHYINLDIISAIYVGMILLLLIIMISSALTIPTFKEILESKYQAANKISLTDQHLQHIQMFTVDKLRQRVRRYWVMAETGSPHFMMAANPLSTASGLICVIGLLMNVFLMIMFTLGRNWKLNVNGSQYKWSTTVIYITQSIGVVVGTIAPAFRCFSVLSFNVATNWNGSGNHFMCLKVERYWTQKLHEWKQSHVPFLSFSRRSRSVIYNSKDIILSVCIRLQKVVVMSCKVLWFIAIIFVVNWLCCWKSFKAWWFTPSIASRTDEIVDEDLSNYVLQVDDETKLAEKTLKSISDSMNSFILNTTKEQNNSLLLLLEKSTGFEGVEIFDMEHVQPLLPIQLVNSWSLPIITLTCIAIAIPNIAKDTIESLIESVDEGLSYTHLVEEVLNCSNEYVDLQKASMALWHEVENKRKWLDNPLAKNLFKGKSTSEIVKWFSDKAKETVTTEINESTNGEAVENPPKTLIAANSMYRITQSILLRYQNNIEVISKKQLFAILNGMIADIFRACFTNIPRVIAMKCHESVIEKREASVKVAAKLLGKTMKIIERIETHELPTMDYDKMVYIDEWRLYFRQNIP